jgi:cytosine/adenosine deaminase-related metal-dependent hydrolase
MTIHNQDVHMFVVRTEDKLREHFAGTIAAARARGLAPVFDFEPGDDADELVEPAPMPRRQRKRSLVKVCEAARKAGADRVIVDGVVIVLSPVAAAPESTANEWDAVLPEGDHGPH